MKRNWKFDHLSIRWKMFAYLAVFVGILIVLLWLFQTVFLDSFYRTIKTASIKSTAEQIAHNIDHPNLSERLETISRQNEVCIRIVDSNYNDLYNSEIMPNCFIHHMTNLGLQELYQKAKANRNSALQQFSAGEFMKNFFAGDRNVGREVMPPPFRRDNQSMIYAKIATAADGSERMILLNAMISPVNATVDTLRIQLICITVIFLILAMLLAFFISTQISKPIVKINSSAKELAHGHYNTQFCGAGYREIAELNDTLNYAADELSKVESLRRELIANISHDLRTPLTMITGYGEVMRDIPGENTPENVQIIIDEAKRLSSLVDDILDLSKLQSGTQELTCSRFNLTEDIRDMLKRYAKFTEQNGYHLKFISDRDAFVYADEIKMSQVIYNFINNAINYTGSDNSITVCQSMQNNMVKIEVIDTGAGIPKEQLAYVWDRYYRIDKAHKRSAIGTGLGLSIIKTILDMHGANYGVISTEGQGSIFWFELPTVE